MADIETKLSQNQPLKTQKMFIGAQIFLRIVVVATSFASAWLMLTNKQIIDIGGFVLDANYKYSPEFRFLSYANIVVGAFSFMSFLFLVLVGRRSSNPTQYFILFLHDLALMCLLIGGMCCCYCNRFLGEIRE
ncbi:hypothetical protein OIU76_000369 [Salix suchowensis]|nr:hypothetical protein OIU76_000369 [Salix suchowensis]